MPGPSKIATCCYCGTRAALVLRGKDRKELTCASCGAPLHNLKNLPAQKHKSTKSAKQAKPEKAKFKAPAKRKPSQNRKKKRKGLMAKVFEEAWDVIEDVFD